MDEHADQLLELIVDRSDNHDLDVLSRHKPSRIDVCSLSERLRRS